MDVSSEIKKITKKLASISNTLQNLFPKVSVSDLKQTIFPISSSLAVSSRLESNTGKIYSIS